AVQGTINSDHIADAELEAGHAVDLERRVIIADHQNLGTSGQTLAARMLNGPAAGLGPCIERVSRLAERVDPAPPLIERIGAQRLAGPLGAPDWPAEILYPHAAGSVPRRFLPPEQAEIIRPAGEIVHIHRQTLQERPAPRTKP